MSGECDKCGEHALECKYHFPEDQWVKIPDEKLAKIGKTQWVYKPSNYPGPIAINCTIKKNENGMD